jgi:hypothetical protein
MITQKAKELSVIAQDLYFYRREDWEGFERACKDCYKEIFDNCYPTKEEWCELVNHLIMSREMMWDFVLHVPLWQIENRKIGAKIGSSSE